MTPEVAEALAAAIVEILEVSAFELADLVEPTEPPADALGATLVFHGPPSGTMRMWIDAAEARAFTAAALGQDEPTPAALADAIRELANMIAGHVLGRVWTDVCVALDGAVLGAPDSGAAYPVQLAGEHGRIAVALEVTP